MLTVSTFLQFRPIHRSSLICLKIINLKYRPFVGCLLVLDLLMCANKISSNDFLKEYVLGVSREG